MASEHDPSSGNPTDSTVVPYIRFLERRAWRARIAGQLREVPDADLSSPDITPRAEAKIPCNQ
jgi:hypothetical protein